MRTYWLMLSFLVSLFVSLSVVAGVENYDTEEVYNLVAAIEPSDQTSHVCLCLYREKGPDWCAACNLFSGSNSEGSDPSNCQIACLNCYKEDQNGHEFGPCGTIYYEKKLGAASKIWKAVCGLVAGSCSQNPDACDCGIACVTCCKDDSQECKVGPCGILYAAKQIGASLSWKLLGGGCFGENEVQASTTNCKMGLCGIPCLDCKGL